jgi:hypothetical protein
MIYTSQVIINRIREAATAQQVLEVIEDWKQSLRFSADGNRIDRKYTMDILMAIKYHKSKESNTKSVDNLNVAIDILRKLHSEGHENFW